MQISVEEIVHDTPAYWQSVELRRTILRTPLGLDYDPMDLAAESTDIHLGAYLDGVLTGCLILTPLSDRTLKMRQVAVAESHQGMGIGRLLVDSSEALARERGVPMIVLNARDTAVPFYLRLEYQVDGPEFVEVGIPHRRMVKAMEAPVSDPSDTSR